MQVIKSWLITFVQIIQMYSAIIDTIIVGCGCDNNDDMIVVSCSHKMNTKPSMVAILGIFYPKNNDDKVSHLVSSHGQLFQPY